MTNKTHDPELEKLAKSIVSEHLTAPYNPESIDFDALCSIRYDPWLYRGPLSLEDATNAVPLDESFFFLFDYQVKRLNKTISFFGLDYITITKQQLLSELTNSLQQQDRLQSYKIRVLVSKKGQIKTEVTQLDSPLNLDPNCAPDWTVYLDNQPTLISPFTSFKTTNRPHYTAARDRKIPPGAENVEVLLYNHANQIMESSICNIAVMKDDKHPVTGEVVRRWTTPVLSSGCQCGVTRQYLLDQKVIYEKAVTKNDIHNGDEILLFNAVRGILKGRVVND